MQQSDGEFTIRPATGEDAIAAADVSTLAFESIRHIYRPTGEAAARQAERSQEGTRLVAVVNSSIVGTVQFAIHAKHIHLIGLAVHPDQRHRGIARNMIEWVACIAPTYGRNMLAADTIKETGNVAFFEKVGFHVVKESVASWCESDTYPELHDVTLERTME